MSEFLNNLQKFGYAKLSSVFNEQEKKILYEYSSKILSEGISRFVINFLSKLTE